MMKDRINKIFIFVYINIINLISIAKWLYNRYGELRMKTMVTVEVFKI